MSAYDGYNPLTVFEFPEMTPIPSWRVLFCGVSVPPSETLTRLYVSEGRSHARPGHIGTNIVTPDMIRVKSQVGELLSRRIRTPAVATSSSASPERVSRSVIEGSALQSIFKERTGNNYGTHPCFEAASDIYPIP